MLLEYVFTIQFKFSSFKNLRSSILIKLKMKSSKSIIFLEYVFTPS